MYDPTGPAIAFHHHDLVAVGTLSEVAREVKAYTDANPDATVLTFDATTSSPVDLDLRGTADEVVARLEALAPPASAEKRGPGRPKLGVVAREVTLLPRHWEWLSAQPGGASVTLRKLVEQARKDTASESRVREARDAAYRFMFAVAGDLPGFEEATRALYAGDRQGLGDIIREWPEGVRSHTSALAASSFEDEAQ